MRRVKNSRLFDIQNCPYAKFEFPPEKPLPCGDSDPICRICFESCADNSSCNVRYHQVQGYWVTRNPEMPHDHVRGEDDEPDIFPLCDKCYDATEVYEYTYGGKHVSEYFVVMGCEFKVDSDYRMND